MAEPFSNPSFGVASADNKALADAASNLSNNPLAVANPNLAVGGKVKPKIFQYRYPLNRIESGSDYLMISVLDYDPVKLDIKSVLQEKNVAPEGSEPKYEYKAIENGGNLLNVSSTTARQRLQNKNPLGYIYLPIPQNIQDTTSVSWGEDSLDPLSAFGLSFGADAMKDVGGAVREYVSLASSKIGDALRDPTAQKALIAAISGQAFGALGGNVSASGLIARATGQVFNPNMELLFGGVNIRSFSFNFDFVARNSKEGDEIKQIIRTLKQSMSATNNSNNSALSGVFIGSPKVFQLEYRKGNAPHPFLNRFLPMALTNVSVNYTGSNTYATYWDGTPVHITMQLDFQELNPLYAEDYDSADGSIGVGY